MFSVGWSIDVRSIAVGWSTGACAGHHTANACLTLREGARCVWANDKICMTPAEAQRRLDNKNIETVQPPRCTKRSGGKLRLFIGFCMRACFCVGIRTFRSCQAVGDRAFCVAGPHVWNCMSSLTQNAPPLPVFRRLLKCELFRRCYDLC